VVRTVRVRLELEDNDFKQGLRDDAAALRTFDAEVQGLGKDAERTGVELKQSASEVRGLGDDVKKSSRDVDSMGTSAKKLGEEVQKTKVKIGDLGKDSKGELGGLVDEFDKAGRKGGRALTDGLTDSLRDFKAQSGAILPATIAVAITEGAPVIGAALSAAILTGLGLTGLAAGIALTIGDPQIKVAGKQLSGEIGMWLEDTAVAHFREPMLESMALLGAGFEKLEPRIQRVFAGLAPELEGLTDGLVQMADRAGPGLERAFAASVPLVRTLANDLPALGDAVSGMFDSFARSEPGAERFLHFFLTWLDGALRGVGYLTEGLSKIFEVLTSGAGLVSMFGPLGTVIEAVTGKQDRASTSADNLTAKWREMFDSANRVSAAAQAAGLGVSLAADDFNKLSAQISATRTNTDMLAASMVDKVLGATLGLDQATLSFAQAQTQLGTVLQNNHHLQDISTLKGQELRGAVLGVVQANLAEYDAMIRAGAGAQEAATAYDTNTAALENQLHKAHLTQGEIDQLVGKYRGVPHNVDTAIELHGVAEAINNLADILARINHVTGTHYGTVIITEQYRTSSPYAPGGSVYRSQVPGAQRYGGVYEHAAIGKLRDASISSAKAPARYAFAEPADARREAFVPKSGNYGRSMSILARAAGWYGASVVPGGWRAAGRCPRPASTSPVNAGMGTDGTGGGPADRGGAEALHQRRRRRERPERPGQVGGSDVSISWFGGIDGRDADGRGRR
jgi:hypothetical protein